ncbi:MAG: AAA family ATPase, partial [Burkholderiales bacterium]|nr:AAA family ATPase [Burkholderiales bacterium]
MNAPPSTIAVPQPDPARIRQALDSLCDPDDMIELRAISTRGRKQTSAGYFDAAHREELIREAIRLNKQGAAVYVTVNAIDPQLLGRYDNRIEQNATATTTDANVIRRRWLLLDFDPVRPKDTSATDAQFEAAKDRARECYTYLREQGWTDPVSAISGNGMHLLYPIDLPNDDETRNLIKGALAALADRFDDDAVQLDQSVFNAARITKLYGTVAKKGDHTELAPHRLSHIVKAPGRTDVVTAEQLHALVPVALVKRPAARFNGTYHQFDPLDFLPRLGIDYRQEMHEGSERFKLETCPFNADHGRGEAAIFRAADGKLGFKCQHSSCSDKHWQDVRELIDGHRSDRTGRATANGNRGIVAEPHASGANKQASADKALPVTYRRVSDVQAVPIRWLWKGRIARGKVSLLAGNPGLGKSQIAVHMAAIVSTGGTWPDGAECGQGNVIILSAEDDAADTIRPRLEAVGADLTRVFILDAIVDSYSADGEECGRAFNLKSDVGKLEAMLSEIGGVALIVIDPVSAYLGDTDSHKNADVRAILSPLSS